MYRQQYCQQHIPVMQLTPQEYFNFARITSISSVLFCILPVLFPSTLPINVKLTFFDASVPTAGSKSSEELFLTFLKKNTLNM
jgi:hypothetical protein